MPHMTYEQAVEHLQNGKSVIYRRNKSLEPRIISSLRDMPTRAEWAGSDPKERTDALTALMKEKKRLEEQIVALTEDEEGQAAESTIVETSAYDGMTKDELAAACKERGLAVSGNKDELIARLEEDDLAQLEKEMEQE